MQKDYGGFMAYLANSHSRDTSEDPTSTGSSDEFKHSRVNKPVFFITAGLIIAFVLWAWIAPAQAETVIFGSMNWIAARSEEHTSELQSRFDLVCRLLL